MPVGRAQSAAVAPRGDVPARPDLRLFVPDEPPPVSPTTPSGDPLPLADTRSVRWLSITDEARREFFGGGGKDLSAGLPLSDWGLSGRLSVVKHGPHRTVYRLRPVGPGVSDPTGAPVWYLKRFCGGGWFSAVRDRLLGSRAEREFAAARRLAELRIPTIEPVLLGVASRGGGTAGDSWLATRGIEEGTPLDEFVPALARTGSPSERTAFRQWLAGALGQVAGRLHRAGIRHPDLHAGNILVARDAAKKILAWKLWLIDLHAVRIDPRASDLPEAARRGNVAELHRFFADRSTRSDRARFWRAYREERQETAVLPERERARRTAWEQVLAQAVETGLDRADRAWRRGNRHVRRQSTARGEFRAVATISRGAWEAWTADPEQILATAAVRWCKNGATRRVAAVSFPEPEAVAYLKRIDRSGLGKRLSDGSSLPVARRAWEIGHQLLRRGIDTPRPLAYAAVREQGASVQYLLTEGITDSLTLLDWCAELRAREPDGVRRRAALRPRAQALAILLARLHAGGFDHRDLKFQNLLVVRGDLSGRVWLLDLDGVRHHRLVRRLPGGEGWFRSRRVQNLARLAASALAQGVASASDALRFLKTYLGRGARTDWKGWWRAILARVDSKRRRNTRRGRPLA